MKEIKNVAELNQALKQDKPILLDFYANWCGPCRILLPTVERLSEKYNDDFQFFKINVDSNQEIAQQFGVRSIPSLFFIQDGEVQENVVGVMSETRLDAKIQHYIQANTLT